jgi:hypothetical protein
LPENALLHLLTFGVLAFQVAILVTIIGFARIGQRWLNVTALAWTAFTLFGSIYTFGLLLLQLVTIVIAYAIGRFVISRKPSPTVTQT